MDKVYYLAADCPNCGESDGPHLWKGARMGSTTWGHNYLCCSDKCGREFLNNPKRAELDAADIHRQISVLKARLTELEGEDG